MTHDGKHTLIRIIWNMCDTVPLRVDQAIITGIWCKYSYHGMTYVPYLLVGGGGIACNTRPSVTGRGRARTERDTDRTQTGTEQNNATAQAPTATPQHQKCSAEQSSDTVSQNTPHWVSRPKCKV